MSQIGKWRHLARRWEDQGPPATPSTQDVDIFLGVLRRYVQADKPTFGVLGCTPSIRRRVYQQWPMSRLLIIDFCYEMYLATSEVLSEEIKSHEEYFAIDWLDMGTILPNTVDAFVGDKSLDNVDAKDWPIFFSSLVQALRPGGLLTLHVGFPDPTLADKPFEAIVRPWVEALALSEDNTRSVAAGLWEDLLSGSASCTTNYLSLEPYRVTLERYSKLATPTGSLCARVLKDYAGELEGRWTNFQEADVIAAAKACGLHYVEKQYGDDYKAARHQPIVTFRLAPH